MVVKASRNRKASGKKAAKGAVKSSGQNGSSQEITPEQLVNAVGSVFNYIEGIRPEGGLTSVTAHAKALQSLYLVQLLL